MPSTVSQLAARPDVTIGFVLFIEGSYLAYTTHPDLVGEGASSWVGTANGARRVVEGLLIDEGQTITHSTNTETGMLENSDDAEFVIEDYHGLVIAFMDEQAETSETVGEMLLPLDTPAPANLFASDGDELVPLHGRFLNGEAIGAAGERHVFQIFPGDPMPGLAHCAYTGDMQTIAKSQVYTSAPFLAGRRVALYRIFKDVTSTAAGYLAWPSWDDQAAVPESLAFLGTLEKPKVSGRTWTFPAKGVSSWLCRQLNTSRPSTWEGVSSTLKLNDTPGAREDLWGVALYYQEGGTGTVLRGVRSFFDPLNVLPLTGSPDAYRAAINLRLATLMATAPGGDVDIQWDAFYNANIRLEAGYIEMKIDDAGWAACATLLLPEKVLRYLGYAPDLQAATTFENEGDLLVYTPDEVEVLGFGPPGPGYWGLRLSTTPIGFSEPMAALDKADNDGKPRRFQSRTVEGVNLLYPGADQEILVGLGPSVPFIQGQTNRAPGEHTMSDSGGDVDTQGYFVFKSAYDDGSEGDDKIETMVGVAKCGWVNNDDFNGATFGVNASSYCQLWIEKWLDPRWFGIDRVKPQKVWASAGGTSESGLRFAPFAMVGYNLNFGDRADLIMLRTMLSTGTSSLAGYDLQNPVRTLGVNAHPDATYTEGDDVEIADLGLAIPSAIVDYKSFIKTASLLPNGGGDSPLNRVKFGYIGSFSSQDLIEHCIRPRGWNMGWVRGQFRLFSLAQPINLADVEVTIEPDDFAGGVAADLYIEEVEFDALTAKDKFKINVSGSLVEDAAGEEPLTYSTNAHDPGARTRQGNAELEMDGAGLIQTNLWRGHPNGPDLWGSSWATLWGSTMAEFYGGGATVVTVTLRWGKARLLGCGSVVRFTGYFAATLTGTYGVSNRVGRCISIAHNLLSGEAVVRLLLAPGDASVARQFSPSAWVLDDVSTVEERHDAANRTFYLYQDFYGVGNPLHHDVTAFEEPAALNVGGDLLAQVWQHDGRVWSQTCSFVVESISESGDSITYTAAGLTGTFHEAQYACIVVGPWDDQDSGSWPRSLFSVHTRSNTKFGGVPTKGFKLT